MSRGRGLRAAAIVVAAAVLTAASAPADGAGRGKGKSWRPGVAAAKRYAAKRAGVVHFAVIGPDGDLRGRQAKRTSSTASVIKAMLLVSYLRQGSVRHRKLGAGDRALLQPMITRSDNGAASQVNAIVGGRIYRIARAAHMRDFHWAGGAWGSSQSSPRDQARFFFRIDRLLPKRHRGYAMHLLANIVGPQRWGVGRVKHKGWRLFFKGGWSGALDHQVALLRRGKKRVALAVFTDGNPSQAYGNLTLRGTARRLLAGLP